MMNLHRSSQGEEIWLPVQEEHAAQVDLLTAVHADQEALIGDLSEQLIASKARCAELDATLADLCGPPRALEGGPKEYPTRVAQLQAAESCIAQLTGQLAEAKASLSHMHQHGRHALLCYSFSSYVCWDKQSTAGTLSRSLFGTRY